MARLRLFDHLQNFKFHLFDVSWSLSIPPFALSPIYGFNAITSPEIQVETEEYAEGNHWFKRHLIVGGNLSNITLSQGVTVFNSEFWNWIKASLRGTPPSLLGLDGKRRNLLLVHYTGYSAAAALDNQAIPTVMSGALGLLPSPGGVLSLPGKAWFLGGVTPVSYKAASDFDATSGDVSLATLELSLDFFEEVGLAA